MGTYSALLRRGTAVLLLLRVALLGVALLRVTLLLLRVPAVLLLLLVAVVVLSARRGRSGRVVQSQSPRGDHFVDTTFRACPGARGRV